MGSYSQPPWAPWSYAEVNDSYPAYQQYPNYSTYLADSMEAYQTQHHHLVHHHQMSRTTESKPRLSKEEVEILEAEFQKNHKPNSSTKKALAESMRVDNARINNWFQNRRAREKKEKNIREYEARQKLENVKNEDGTADSKLSDRSNELVASSAPFPAAQDAPQLASEKRDASQVPEQGSGTPHLSDESNDVKDEKLSPELPSGIFGLPSSEERFDALSHEGDCTSPSNGTPDANEPEFALSTNGEDPDYYGQQIRHSMAGSINSLYSYAGEDLMGFPPSQPSGDDSGLSSPPNIDIASRRNRRPPPLSIDGSRSYSGAAPRTAVEMGKRPDTMRRVASATGTLRVSKPMGMPRSPFQKSRSPVSAAPKGSKAPPTPDTPILANQPTNTNVSSLGSTTAISSSDLPIRDPTLRTPPTTPGGMQNYFSIRSVYDMPMAGDGYATTSMNNFTGDFNASNISSGYPHHIANPNTGVGQPPTSCFVSPMAGSSFGITGGNPEYTWPDSVISRNQSPGEQQQGSQFLNMPASGFGMER